MGNLPSRANACGAAFDSADANAARIADDSATSRARNPLRLMTVMSTSSRDKRRRAASNFPALAAQCNGVDPSSSRGSVAAPRENKSRSAPTSPQYAATCVGVSPSAPTTFGVRPAIEEVRQRRRVAALGGDVRSRAAVHELVQDFAGKMESLGGGGARAG